MYGALWRVLPGPWWLRLLLLLALVEWVFPLVNELIPAPDVTVEDS